MKGGIACFISAISKFIKDKNFKGSISIIIAADEETTGYGCPAVLKYLKKRGIYLFEKIVSFDFRY